MRKYKIYSVIATLTAIIFIIAFFAVFFHGGYDNKILFKLGLADQAVEVNYAVKGWTDCLEKLSYDSDIVFLGDSITRGSSFHEYFTDKKIVNLGYSGDTIKGVENRLEMVKAVFPEKIFLLIGINDLTDYNVDRCAKNYSELLEALHAELPEAKIYVQSVLPVSKAKEKKGCRNDTIEKFNAQIKGLSKKYQMTYIDLFSFFFKDGELDPKLTTDGVHLQKEAYAIWADVISSYV